MLKNDKSYTFLLSHSSRNRIYIKRFAVSKSLVHFGSVGVFLFLCTAILGVGIGRIVETPVFAEAVISTSQTELAVAQPVIEAEAIVPGSDVVANSGGPADNVAAAIPDSEIDADVLAVRNGSDPANLPTMWAHL